MCVEELYLYLKCDSSDNTKMEDTFAIVVVFIKKKKAGSDFSYTWHTPPCLFLMAISATVQLYEGI